jgi:hypothetical protein
MKAFALGIFVSLAAPLAFPVMMTGQTAPISSDLAALDTFLEVLAVKDLIDVMHQEGIKSADGMDADMLGGSGGQGWSATIAGIYDPAKMYSTFKGRLQSELAQDKISVEKANAFFGSDLGQKVIKLEIEARRALLNEAAEAAAEAGYYGMVEKNEPRVAQIKRFAEANDLIESNVMGAMNGNLAFFRGLAAGGATQGLSESDMLAEVWSGEAEARTQAEVWLYPFLALAYEPLSDAELDAYIAFSQSPAGARINAALFAAFDTLFVDISEKLGKAAAAEMTGQDI